MAESHSEDEKQRWNRILLKFIFVFSVCVRNEEEKLEWIWR